MVNESDFLDWNYHFSAVVWHHNTLGKHFGLEQLSELRGPLYPLSFERTPASCLDIHFSEVQKSYLSSINRVRKTWVQMHPINSPRGGLSPSLTSKSLPHAIKAIDYAYQECHRRGKYRNLRRHWGSNQPRLPGPANRRDPSYPQISPQHCGAR